jgi:hypothetical protein
MDMIWHGACIWGVIVATAADVAGVERAGPFCVVLCKGYERWSRGPVCAGADTCTSL